MRKSGECAFMKAHELARILLEMPNVEVFIPEFGNDPIRKAEKILKVELYNSVPLEETTEDIRQILLEGKS